VPVPFIVEPEAFDCGARDRGAWIASHERILQSWGKYGVLVLPALDGTIGEVLARLPQQMRTKWLNALKSAQFRRRVIGSLDTPEALQSFDKLVALSSDIKLACLEETRAFCFGLDEDTLSKLAPDGSFEICRFEFIDQSHFFRSEAELWNRMIYAGTDRNHIWLIWLERFNGLALDARNIAIIDRYCLNNFEKLYHRGKACGLTFFLNKVAKLPRGKSQSLNIFTSDVDIEHVATTKHLRESIGKIKFPFGMTVHLHVIRDYVFSKVAHDRFLRFDAIVTSIGSGLRIFENDVSDINFDCALKWDSVSDFRGNVEAKLRCEAQSERIL
jgi:hypothetical protein